MHLTSYAATASDFPSSPRDTNLRNMGQPVKGDVGIGVKTRQVTDKMERMFNNRPSWFLGRRVIISMGIL